MNEEDEEEKEGRPWVMQQKIGGKETVSHGGGCKRRLNEISTWWTWVCVLG